MLFRRRNRYILECKGGRIQRTGSRRGVEIDTFWNVKKTAKAGHIKIGSVEIDTFWNVKSFIWEAKASGTYVEIDTFWNVKVPLYRIHQWKSHSRNRYILECKDARSKTLGNVSTGRNRYILECKDLSVVDFLHF